MTEERDALSTQLSELQALAETAQSELAAALSSVGFEACKRSLQHHGELTAPRAQQDAVEHQRFWLAILLDSVVAIGYLLMRGRKES